MTRKRAKHIVKRLRVRVEHETELTPYPPTHRHLGGVLQKLGRTWALRLADEVTRTEAGNWILVRHGAMTTEI